MNDKELKIQAEEKISKYISAQYDKTNKESIKLFSKKLENKTAREILIDLYSKKVITEEEYKNLLHIYGNTKNKGALGTLIELVGFGNKPNSSHEADLVDANIEIKATALLKYKTKKKSGHYRFKERLVFSMINYMDIIKTDFSKSVLYEKMKNLILICYFYDDTLNPLDFKIVKVMYNNFDYLMSDIETDYKYIKNKVSNGQAHLLSESDTKILKANTKSKNALDTTKQPKNKVEAKKRSFSLNTTFMNKSFGTRLNP